MDKSRWESLLDDINRLKEKDPPSADDAPRIQSLLTQVNELSGTAPPFTRVGRQDEEGDWFDGAATPKSPPEGRIRVEANKPKPLSGDIQTQLVSLREAMGVEPPEGEPKRAKTVEPVSFEEIISDKNVLWGFLAKRELTEEDLNTLVSVADHLKRQKEAAPNAFEETPEIAGKFLKHFEATKSAGLDSLLQKKKRQGREPTPKELADLDKTAAALAQKGVNAAMTGSAAIGIVTDNFEKSRVRPSDEDKSKDATVKNLHSLLMDGPPADEESREPKYGSLKELKSALDAMGPGAFIIGRRPLVYRHGPYGHTEEGSRADVENRGVYHQHIFYLDAEGVLRDVGFTPDGILKGWQGMSEEDRRNADASDELDKIDQYDFGDIVNFGVLRPEMFDLKGFDASNYRLITHNCQDFVDAVIKMLQRTQGGVPPQRSVPGS